MKTLKTKTIFLLSILTLVTFGVLITSCEKDELVTEPENEAIESENTSTVASSVIGQLNRDVIALYFTHESELSEILWSDKPEYQTVQTAFSRFWTVNEDLLVKGVSTSDNVAISAEQITAAMEVLTELQKITRSPELLTSISEIRGSVETCGVKN